MIIKFQRFNEDLIIDALNIKEGDRVVGVGSIKRFDMEEPYSIDVDGQTGVVISFQRGVYMFYGVVFDNYFCPLLINLENRTKIKRGLWLGQKNLKKIEQTQNKRLINLSPKLKILLEYIEYLGKPIFSKGDIDYIDTSSSPHSVTYMPVDRIEKLDFNDDQWNNKYRQEMRIGKFLQMINPYTDQKSLDKKINIYKSVYNNLIDNKYNFKLVGGEEIRKWYDETCYHDGSGSLNKSCMRNKMDRLSIYTENPDKVNLLIMVDDDDKLMGRSLIWKVDKPNITYMDRPYTIFKEDEEAFSTYAYKHGWSFWTDSRENLIIYLKRNYGSPGYNPYMDTFQYFCSKGDDGENYLSVYSSGCKKYYVYDEI